MKWQISNGYGKRSPVETAVGRYNSIIGRRLRVRSRPGQETEGVIRYAVLNRMLDCARPKSVGRKVPRQSARLDSGRRRSHS